MSAAVTNPLRAPLVILMVALSFSVGWGIRGNFGHEAGAMIPGALGAIAIAVCSRRADWQARIPHAALLGGLGMGFGGSISYMYPLSFTMSGHFPTMYYGFLTTFLEGGLWCALGTAGAALALTADRDRLAQLYKPLLVVLAAMWIHNLTHERLEQWLATPERADLDSTWHRQESPLYWFDADWMSALFAFFGVCVYNLWDRMREPSVWGKLGPILILIAVATGAVLGQFVQFGLDRAGLLEPLANFLVVPQGDLSAINPATGQPFEPANLMTNWPQFFGDYPQHVGWLSGAVLGFVVYFVLFGKWRGGAGLFAAMSLGWLIAFLAMPVFGSIYLMDYGGFRAMPPRSDDWAGIVGVFAGAWLWTRWNDYKAVTLAATLGFLLGGLGFTTAQLFRCLAMLPGNRYRFPETQFGEFLTHYQSANWHSVLEQSQGFCLGLAMVVSLGVVWRVHTPRDSDQTLPKWTSVFSAVFVMFVITFFNIFKNVRDWTGGDSPLVPKSMTAPLLSFIELDAAVWFNLVWWAAALAALCGFALHTRRPVALLSGPPAGRGQMLHLCILWLMVIMNFSRALPFTEGRLITEWSVAMNACLAMGLFLTRPTEPGDPLALPIMPLPRLGRIWAGGLAGAVALMLMYAITVKIFYGDATVIWPDGAHKRFGPEAVWRTKPILKNEEHR